VSLELLPRIFPLGSVLGLLKLEPALLEFVENLPAGTPASWFRAGELRRPNERIRQTRTEASCKSQMHRALSGDAVARDGRLENATNDSITFGCYPAAAPPSFRLPATRVSDSAASVLF
jgi:hypothetical protein